MRKSKILEPTRGKTIPIASLSNNRLASSSIVYEILIEIYFDIKVIHSMTFHLITYCQWLYFQRFSVQMISHHSFESHFLGMIRLGSFLSIVWKKRIDKVFDVYDFLLQMPWIISWTHYQKSNGKKIVKLLIYENGKIWSY